MKLYRVMKVDADGKPLVGTRRNMLGVRPTDPDNRDPRRRFDVPAVADADPVGPGSGLSTSEDRGQLRPGPGEAVFEIETADLAPGLKENPDNVPHYLLQPSATTTLGEFQQALADTRDLWKPVQ